MTDTTTFAFARATDDIVNIRSTLIDGEPWFVARDVCEALALARMPSGGINVWNATRGIPDGMLRTETRTSPHLTRGCDHLFPGRSPRVSLLSEAGVYFLAMRSDKPEARVFQTWIASEVLPAIRKTGKYALADHGREAMPLHMDIAESFAVVLEMPDAPALDTRVH